MPHFRDTYGRAPQPPDAPWGRLNAEARPPRIDGQPLTDGALVHLLTSNGKAWIGVRYAEAPNGGGLELLLADDDEPVRLPLRHNAVARLSAYQRSDNNLPPRIRRPG